MSCLDSSGLIAYSILITYIALTGGVAFLIGSIPFGYLIGRTAGVDVRTHGSGNIGATNVGRVLGKKWGLFVFFLDFLKGYVPLLLAYGGLVGKDPGPVPIIILVWGLAVILGHNYTPWLKFRGGKGIATSAGVVCALIPQTGLASIALWILLILTTRYVSVASMGAALSLLLCTIALDGSHLEHFIFGCAVCVLSLWRHRANISRLRAGTEPKWKRASA